MEGISLGPLLLRWNGLLFMIGFTAGAVLTARISRRRGYDPELLLDLVLPLLIWGAIGARLWHILTPPLSSLELGLTSSHYLSHPLDLFAIWIGGLGWPGALAGGSLGLYIFCRKRALVFHEWLDMLAPGLALGQAIGRFGNFINQELYGLPTNLPWGIYIDVKHRLSGYENVEYYHPLFAYESIPLILISLVLLRLSGRFGIVNKPGELFLVYLLLTAGIRFLLEYLRLDNAMVGGINVNQAIMGIVVLVCVSILGFKWLKL